MQTDPDLDENDERHHNLPNGCYRNHLNRCSEHILEKGGPSAAFFQCSPVFDNLCAPPLNVPEFFAADTENVNRTIVEQGLRA